MARITQSIEFEKRSWLKRLQEKQAILDRFNEKEGRFFEVDINYLEEFCPDLLAEASLYFSLKEFRDPNYKYNNLFIDFNKGHESIIFNIDELIEWVKENAPNTIVLYYFQKGVDEND